MNRHASVLATTQRSRVHAAAVAAAAAVGSEEEEGDDEAGADEISLRSLTGLAVVFGSVQPPRIRPVDSTLEKR